MSFLSKAVGATGLGAAVYSAWNACQSIGPFCNKETIYKLALEACKQIPYILPDNAVHNPSSRYIHPDTLFNDEGTCHPQDLSRISSSMIQEACQGETPRLVFNIFVCCVSLGIAYSSLRNRASKEVLPTTQD